MDDQEIREAFDKLADPKTIDKYAKKMDETYRDLYNGSAHSVIMAQQKGPPNRIQLRSLGIDLYLYDNGFPQI